ncbi:MAG: hypothetical protein ACFE9S_16525 [Candidatus Hermodarchaeota archaeon]
MLSKRSKIILGLLSLGIIGFLSTTVLAAQYHHEHYIQGWAPVEPMIFVKRFQVTAKLDVTADYDDIGLVITSYTKSYSFWTDGYWIFWPFIYQKYFKFVNVVEQIEYTRWSRWILAVKYSVEGKVQSRLVGSAYVMVNVWVKIWADGVKEGGFSWWDDNLGYLYLGPM